MYTYIYMYSIVVRCMASQYGTVQYSACMQTYELNGEAPSAELQKASKPGAVVGRAECSKMWWSMTRLISGG